MSATPESTLADPQQIIADLKHELVECRGQRDKAQRNLDEKTSELDEALAQGGPRRSARSIFLPVAEDLCGDLPAILIHTDDLDVLLDLRQPAFDGFF
jgi:hypothetical protein